MNDCTDCLAALLCETTDRLAGHFRCEVCLERFVKPVNYWDTKPNANGNMDYIDTPAIPIGDRECKLLNMMPAEVDNPAYLIHVCTECKEKLVKKDE